MDGWPGTLMTFKFCIFSSKVYALVCSRGFGRQTQSKERFTLGERWQRLLPKQPVADVVHASPDIITYLMWIQLKSVCLAGWKVDVSEVVFFSPGPYKCVSGMVILKNFLLVYCQRSFLKNFQKGGYRVESYLLHHRRLNSSSCCYAGIYHKSMSCIHSNPVNWSKLCVNGIQALKAQGCRLLYIHLCKCKSSFQAQCT